MRCVMWGSVSPEVLGVFRGSRAFHTLSMYEALRMVLSTEQRKLRHQRDGRRNPSNWLYGTSLWASTKLACIPLHNYHSKKAAVLVTVTIGREAVAGRN